MNKLSGKQLRYLRSLGHHLKPVVMIGKEELSEQLLTSVDEALAAHELIKIKIQEGCQLEKQTAASLLASRTGAIVAQILGKTILLYRPNADGKISLP